jgi:hypothetical protein
MVVGDGERKPDYRLARQASAVLLIATVVVIVIADSLGFGREVNPIILYGLIAAAAGLLAVDIPGMRNGK